VCAFVQLAGAVIDHEVVSLVVFDVELEYQVQALCCVCVEVLFEFFKYLSYDIVLPFLMVVLSWW